MRRPRPRCCRSRRAGYFDPSFVRVGRLVVSYNGFSYALALSWCVSVSLFLLGERPGLSPIRDLRALEWLATSFRLFH
jgi:hypothetical protein